MGNYMTYLMVKFYIKLRKFTCLRMNLAISDFFFISITAPVQSKYNINIFY